jgi:hypothetical protein
MLKFFLPLEILDAKRILWKCHGDILGKLYTRHGSITRAAHEADLADMLDAAKTLDSAQVCSYRFVAWNLDRIPKYAPEEANLYTLADRIAAIERDVLGLHSILDTTRQAYVCSSAALTSSVTHAGLRVSTSGTSTGYTFSSSQHDNSSVFPTHDPCVTITSDRRVAMSNIDSLLPTSSSSSSSLTSPSLSSQCAFNRDDILVVNLPQVSNCVASVPFCKASRNNVSHIITSVTRPEALHGLSAKPFQNLSTEPLSAGVPSRHQSNTVAGASANRNVAIRQNIAQPQRKPAVTTDTDGFQPVQRKKKIIGTKKTDIPMSQPRTCALFVHRINPDIPADRVKDECTRGGAHVFEIEQVSKESSRFKSFKVVIDWEHMNQALNPNFWPEGVACKRWFTRRGDVSRHRNISESSTANHDHLIGDFRAVSNAVTDTAHS